MSNRARIIVGALMAVCVVYTQPVYAVSGTVTKLMANARGIVYFSTSDCPYSQNQWSIPATATGNRNMFALLLSAKVSGAIVHVGAANGSTSCPTTTTEAFWVQID